MPDGPELVLRLTRLLATQEPTQSLALRLCRAVVGAVEAGDGAISLAISTTSRSVLCGTSADADRFEDAQDVVREGPSLDAHRTGRAVARTSPGEQQRRWPTLAATFGGTPGSDVESLPMRPGSTMVGVLTVHHPVGAVASASPSDLQFLADTVGAAIVGELPHLPQLADLAGPRPGHALWTDRDRVAQATGMVVAQLALSPTDALAVLRAHAFVEGATLLDICRRVVARELDLSLSEGPS